jgi:hypothetical protein
LAKAVQEYQAAKFEAEALLKNLNEDTPSSQSSQSSQTSESQASSMQPSLAETDNVYTIENQTETIGKRIKQEAIDIHDKYVKGIDIGAKAELVMELGLRLILDLTHKETIYQAYIFSHQEIHDIEYFFKMINTKLMKYQLYLLLSQNTVSIIKY